MCCGQKREALRNSGGNQAVSGNAAAPAGAESLYYLRKVPARLRVSLTGRPGDSPGERPRTTDPGRPGGM